LRRTPLFPLRLGFFGLTPEDKPLIYSEIHEIVFNGKGGYSWSEVYNMPIWLRRFTFKKLKEHYDKENEAIEKASKQSKNKKIHKPAIAPDYTTKASTK